MKRNITGKGDREYGQRVSIFNRITIGNALTDKVTLD